ncbi:type ISP restriction/modification enzyme [Ligilactobacillus salivarius]|uniref:Helicase n=1 Tax=Ligilactobacillus salivarius TaxID=1624 RepID=A0A1D7TS67_9LACO|nr:type ISP restriction/modification enzyme [Ligilactobacillus salivarius]AOO73811.1 helicase [Ligilactobacillus salivarius]UDE96604.1 DEAD/DEAH box helicase family protein [Ligilactobacillus salivarius]UUV95731.1 DEAD/DEAH box helicase family protein [Ligilactobacillus salivarius]
MSTFNELVNQIDDQLTNQRDRGTAFEKLAVAYLKNEPAFKNKYSNVWMLNEVPDEFQISKQDTGVDIVAQDRVTGKLTAVQAKYYKGKVGKDTINSFIAETGKEYYTDGMIISSTDDWNKNAKKATEELSKDIAIIGLSQLQNANFDWQLFDFDSYKKDLTYKAKKLRDYQKEAISNALAYFKDHSRGKLIMAPGTGKTFTSLKIAEALMNESGGGTYNVLYLVPSIQLLSQTLFNWNSDKSDDLSMISFSVVSDRKATKKKSGEDDLSAKDIGFPATTNVEELMANYANIKKQSQKTMTVVFSTYQSIDVISKAQKQGYPEFDLIISDEAHRTTGASQMGDASVFTKVHDNDIVKGKLRLYQTATPKVYGPEAKKKADDNSMVISSMDDETKYGTEIFRLGFGDAVSRGYLTDYKVSVLAVSETFVNKEMQKVMASSTSELKTSDIGKIIGVWNAMVKRNGITGEIDGAPMKRAIAFTDTIAHSKQIAKEFNYVINDYLGAQAEDSFTVDVHHVDGGLNALQKKTELDWLASDIADNEARLLSNVRFLTEGIDVPNLDAVIFLSPKKSQVDIVQAVGRIMRKFEGKEYGYIIIPIVIDTNSDPADVLDSNDKYKEVWQVLNALRSTDERFDAEINKLELNKKKSGRINIIGTNTSPDQPITEDDGKDIENGESGQPVQLELNLEEMAGLEKAFYGRIVQKVGDRLYLEDWSKDVAEIAKRHITKINDLIDSQPGAKQAFDVFLTSLQHNINSSVDKKQAIEMLAQHLITQPIFEALFEGYSFVKDNPVSHAMNDVVSAFSVFGFDKEQKELAPFYESVKLRASGIDNAEAKQKIIITLYDKFFRTGFKETTEQLGIVFTPVEVVDFIIKSVDYALNKYFGKYLSSKNVHILDPFTGTGTFMTRTLQYFKQQMDNGEITFEDILHKYNHELHANEIVLLSYYIASINIEAVFDEVNGPERGYEPFEGIVLTDTFESTERENSFMDELLGENNKRLKKQQEQPITAIISNPPYSVGQRNQNDNNENIHYKNLENDIQKTYIKYSKANNSNRVYDSYIKAFRWATNRLENKGIIGFVTNGNFIDNGSTDGLRSSLYKEFNHLYIFNLRGNARTSGEQRRKEKDNVFGQGTRTPITISILIKDGTDDHEIHYHDIGDYLTRKAKLNTIKEFSSINGIDWDKIIPDINNDWINQRDLKYLEYTEISGEKDSVFYNQYIGVNSNRDAWVYGYSKKKMLDNINRMIDNYNIQAKKGYEDKSRLDNDLTQIKWTSELQKKALSGVELHFIKNCVVSTFYRPFTKKWLYYNRELLHRPGKFDTKWGEKNLAIVTTGRSSNKDFSVLAIKNIPDINLMSAGAQTFLRYDNSMNESLLQDNSNVNELFAQRIGLSTDDTFTYVYGLLNSKEYQTKYANDLKKDLARIPIVKDKKKYVEIGKKLMDLHLNYEEVPIYKGVSIESKADPSYKVNKMKFDKIKNIETNKKEKDRSTIIFNTDITIKNIPEKAYEYVVNGKSAIEWIMDQYQVKTDKKSGITDDPNDFSDDPKYIFNLLLRIINVSVQTVDLVNSLPKLEIIE